MKRKTLVFGIIGTFFDSKGKEVFRNTGAMDKVKIVEKLKEVGVGS